MDLNVKCKNIRLWAKTYRRKSKGLGAKLRGFRLGGSHKTKIENWTSSKLKTSSIGLQKWIVLFKRPV